MYIIFTNSNVKILVRKCYFLLSVH